EDCAQIRKQTRKKELKDETVDAHLFLELF
ncbi:hypothetical protein V619_00921, partial [Staphylococcus aureus M79667]